MCFRECFILRQLLGTKIMIQQRLLSAWTERAIRRGRGYTRNVGSYRSTGVVRHLWNNCPMKILCVEIYSNEINALFYRTPCLVPSKEKQQFFLGQMWIFATIRCSRIWLKRIWCNCIRFFSVYREFYCVLNGNPSSDRTSPPSTQCPHFQVICFRTNNRCYSWKSSTTIILDLNTLNV